MSDGIENVSQTQEPKPRVNKATGYWDIDHQLRNLKTVATLSPDAWLRLAKTFKDRQRMEQCEMALIGARYCDFSNRDIMEEWLAVFTFNRWSKSDPKSILREANTCDAGLCDVANHEGRRLEELQALLFNLEVSLVG